MPYKDSETDGIRNLLVTHLGQRYVNASGNPVGLLGGAIMPVDVTKVASAVGHEMEQLMLWMIDPVDAENRENDADDREVLSRLKVALELAIATGLIQTQLNGRFNRN